MAGGDRLLDVDADWDLLLCGSLERQRRRSEKRGGLVGCG